MQFIVIHIIFSVYSLCKKKKQGGGVLELVDNSLEVSIV